MYVRVKRPKQTIFLYVEPSDSIATVKAKVSQLSNAQNENLRLAFSGQYLEEEKTISDSKIENDNILYQVQKKGNFFHKFMNHQRITISQRGEDGKILMNLLHLVTNNSL